MNKEDRSVSMLGANLYSLALALPLVVILALVFIWRWGAAPLAQGFGMLFGRLLVFLAVFILGIIVHELIHGFTWMIFARKPFRAIKFGLDVKTLTPYAHIKEPLPVNPYRAGGAMPGLLMGILPAALGILFGNGWLMAFGLLFTLAAGGDFLILWMIRDVRSDRLIEDHPSRAGCYVITP